MLIRQDAERLRLKMENLGCEGASVCDGVGLNSLMHASDKS